MATAGSASADAPASSAPSPAGATAALRFTVIVSPAAKRPPSTKLAVCGLPAEASRISGSSLPVRDRPGPQAQPAASTVKVTVSRLSPSSVAGRSTSLTGSDAQKPPTIGIATGASSTGAAITGATWLTRLASTPSVCTSRRRSWGRPTSTSTPPTTAVAAVQRVSA